MVWRALVWSGGIGRGLELPRCATGGDGFGVRVRQYVFFCTRMTPGSNLPGLAPGQVQAEEERVRGEDDPPGAREHRAVGHAQAHAVGGVRRTVVRTV